MVGAPPVPLSSPPFVDTLDEAVLVVDAAVGGVASFGAVAVLLADDDRLLTAVECARCDTPERVVELCTVLLPASGGGAWRQLVVASSLGGAADVGPPHVAAWSVLAATFAESPVALVDWLLLDLPAGVVRSVCEAAEGRYPWG